MFKALILTWFVRVLQNFYLLKNTIGVWPIVAIILLNTIIYYSKLPIVVYV